MLNNNNEPVTVLNTCSLFLAVDTIRVIGVLTFHEVQDLYKTRVKNSHSLIRRFIPFTLSRCSAVIKHGSARRVPNEALRSFFS